VRNVISVAQFRRDVKLAEKRGNDMSKLREATADQVPVSGEPQAAVVV